MPRKPTKQAPKKKAYKKRMPVSKSTRAIVNQLKTNNNITVINRKPQSVTCTRTLIDFHSLVNPSTTSDVAGTFQLEFDQIPGYLEFTNLFQKYKINWIRYKFKAVDLNDPNGKHPVVYTWKNYDTSNLAGVINEPYVQQLQNVKRWVPSDLSRTMDITVKPYYLTQAFQSTVSTGYIQTQRYTEFLDIRYDDIQFYAIGYLIPNVQGSVSEYFRIDIDVEVNFTCTGLI